MPDTTALNGVARMVFSRALADCCIEETLVRNVEVHGHELVICQADAIRLDRLKDVRVIAVGKASSAMLEALLSRLRLPGSIKLKGVLIARERPADLPTGFQFFAGGHPSPNEASLGGARAALALLAGGGAESLCIFLISGGGSAMMELPLDAGIPLADTVAFHTALVHSGASIAEINCVRKHFSAVKGGRLAVAADGATLVSLLVSDVPRGHLDALASGPTLADTSTVEECRKILAGYKMLERFPASVQRYFTSAALEETPKPGSVAGRWWTLLDADVLAEAARKEAESLGFHAVVDNTCDDWEYRAAAAYLLDRLRKLRQEYPRVCLISTGEISVALPAKAWECGVGGRNQHFALHVATLLDEREGGIAVLSAGSDGIDGNSEAAGAVVDERTLRGSGLEEGRVALERFDSFSLLERVGATVKTGPTGNNLRDLRILLSERPGSGVGS